MDIPTGYIYRPRPQHTDAAKGFRIREKVHLGRIFHKQTGFILYVRNFSSHDFHLLPFGANVNRTAPGRSRPAFFPEHIFQSHKPQCAD
jgi:hypothetical protein